MKAQHSLKARETNLSIHTVPLRGKYTSCIRCSSLVAVQGSRPQLSAPAELEEGGGGGCSREKSAGRGRPPCGGPPPLNLVVALKLRCTLKETFKAYWCPGLTTRPKLHVLPGLRNIATTFFPNTPPSQTLPKCLGLSS